MTPSQFEEHVAFVIRQLGDFQNAEFQRNSRVQGVRQPGDYEIDIAVRLKFAGLMDFFVIVECKNWKRPVDRPVVQKLAQTRDAVSAHKAAIVSNVGFTKEAVKVAESLGIALWVVAETSSSVVGIMGLRGPSLIRIQEFHNELKRLQHLGFGKPLVKGRYLDDYEKGRYLDDYETDLKELSLSSAPETYFPELDLRLANFAESRVSRMKGTPFKLFSITSVVGSATVGDSLVPGVDDQLAVTSLVGDLEKHVGTKESRESD